MESSNSPWRSIVEIAVRSPSTHNTQGWRIKPEPPDRATLYYDADRTLPAEDVDGDFNIINMGIFTRGMEIAAESLGYRITSVFDLENETPGRKYTKVASLSVQPSDSTPNQSLKEHFLSRSTSRIPYDGRKVNESDLNALKDMAGQHGHRFEWTQDSKEVRWYMELNADTIVNDLRQPAVREELHQWMRFTRRQAETKRDGLWSKCMNQNGVLSWYMTKYPQALKIGWIMRALRRSYLKSQAGTPAIGWISGSIDTRLEQFKAGQFVLDFWLKLTELGIQMLPYGSLYTNRDSNSKVGVRADAPDFWLIFRIGYGPTPPESYRLPPDELFI